MKIKRLGEKEFGPSDFWYHGEDNILHHVSEPAFELLWKHWLMEGKKRYLEGEYIVYEFDEIKYICESKQVTK